MHGEEYRLSVEHAIMFSSGGLCVSVEHLVILYVTCAVLACTNSHWLKRQFLKLLTIL